MKDEIIDLIRKTLKPSGNKDCFEVKDIIYILENFRYFSRDQIEKIEKYDTAKGRLSEFLRLMKNLKDGEEKNLVDILIDANCCSYGLELNDKLFRAKTKDSESCRTDLDVSIQRQGQASCLEGTLSSLFYLEQRVVGLTSELQQVTKNSSEMSAQRESELRRLEGETSELTQLLADAEERHTDVGFRIVHLKDEAEALAAKLASLKQGDSNGDKMVSVCFHFKKANEEANDDPVHLAGNFDCWQRRHLMEKGKNGDWFLTQQMKKHQRVQFKFIRGQQWLCSTMHPTCSDGYYENNYLDI